MSTFPKRVSTKYILADYQKWKGLWVHYTEFPHLKINPRTWHNDPAALYFFPENFRTGGTWHRKRYKFVAEIPDSLRILDLADIKDGDDALNLLKKVGVIPDDKESAGWKKFEHYSKEDRPARAAWNYMKDVFVGKAGLFNKKLREAGYDAVFDDTNSIFTGEVQLLVLDPTKLKNVKKAESPGTGFKEVKDIMAFIEAEGAKYGKVQTDGPIKKWDNWEKTSMVTGTVRIISNDPEHEGKKDHDKPYLAWAVGASPTPFSGSGQKVTLQKGKENDQKHIRKKWKEMYHSSQSVGQITVRVQYSQPSLENEHERKRYYQEDLRDAKMKDIQDMVRDATEHFFTVKLKKKDTDAA